MTDWHHAEIESAVKKQYGSFAGLARSWNAQNPECPVGRDTLVKAAHRRQSAFGEMVISWGVGVPAKEIWPSRYDAKGNRIRLQRKRPAKGKSKPTRAQIFHSVLNGESHE